MCNSDSTFTICDRTAEKEEIVFTITGNSSTGTKLTFDLLTQSYRMFICSFLIVRITCLLVRAFPSITDLVNVIGIKFFVQTTACLFLVSWINCDANNVLRNIVVVLSSPVLPTVTKVVNVIQDRYTLRLTCVIARCRSHRLTSHIGARTKRRISFSWVFPLGYGIDAMEIDEMCEE